MLFCLYIVLNYINIKSKKSPLIIVMSVCLYTLIYVY